MVPEDGEPESPREKKNRRVAERKDEAPKETEEEEPQSSKAPNSTKEDEIEHLKAELAKARAESSNATTTKRARSTSRSRKKKGQTNVDTAAAVIEQELEELNEKLTEKATAVAQSTDPENSSREGHRATANAVDFEALRGRLGAERMSSSNSARSLASASTAASTSGISSTALKRKTILSAFTAVPRESKEGTSELSPETTGYLKSTSGGQKGRARSSTPSQRLNGKGKGKGVGSAKDRLTVDDQVKAYLDKKETGRKEKANESREVHKVPAAPHKPKVIQFNPTERCWQRILKTPNHSYMQDHRWRSEILEYSTHMCTAGFPQPTETPQSSLRESSMGAMRSVRYEPHWQDILTRRW